MIELDDTQVKDIVDQQQMGMRCHIHRQTGQLIAFPEPEQFSDLENEDWQAQAEQVETFPEQYWKVPTMSSREEFWLMEQFARQEMTEPFQSRLLAILGQPKPFYLFKEAIDDAGPHRPVWFAFRDQQKLDWLKCQLVLID